MIPSKPLVKLAAGVSVLMFLVKNQPTTRQTRAVCWAVRHTVNGFYLLRGKDLTSETIRDTYLCLTSNSTATLNISIIIPAYNEEKLLASTLSAVNAARSAFEARRWATELIVCDNNSTDQTAAIAAKFGARVVFEPHNQIARARNTGAAAAVGEWLLFVDADSIPSAELFAKVVEHIDSGRILAGGCVMKVDVDQLGLKVATGLWTFVSRTLKWMAGSFIFVEAEAFRKVGGFSDRLYAAEELDLSRKLKRLARERRKKMVIISSPQLITSGRKAHLYSGAEMGFFFLKAALLPWKMLTRRESCGIWYDGRR
jgi:glycosyltransferase involved in cell wall biosynthesis